MAPKLTICRRNSCRAAAPARSGPLAAALAVAALVTGALAAGALAQPQVTSRTGDWTDGGTVQVFGSGFGTKTQGPPLLWDKLVNQPAYSGLTQGATIPAGSGYPWQSNGGATSAGNVKWWTTAPRVTGRPYYHVQDLGYLMGRDLGGATPNQLYVSWWVRASGNISTGSGGNASTKLIRVWADASGETGRLSWTGMQMTYYALEAGNVTIKSLWNNWGGVPGQWHNLEFLADSRQDVTQSLGVATCLNNNQPIYSNVRFWGASPMNLIDLIGFDPSIPENLDDVYVDFTDIYVDNTFQRIVAGNASTWSAVTHKEIQIPQTWSPTAIAFTANAGSFPAGSSVWYYVFDADGRHNETGLAAQTEQSEAPGQPGQPVRM